MRQPGITALSSSQHRLTLFAAAAAAVCRR
jgi:hypothetical protein